MKMPRIIRRRRAVSPVLAAILLIGLAVAAAAVLFVVVLPMIAGNADVRFVSAVAADRNDDGRLDQITVQVQNKGSAKDIFSDAEISVTGWSAAGNIEISSANPVDLVFKTTDIDEQLEESDSVTITLDFETTADITITETDIDMNHATALSESDMLIDFTAGTADLVGQSGAYTRLFAGTAAGDDATHLGTPGIEMRTDNTDDCYFVWVKAGTAQAPFTTLNDYGNQIVTWNRAEKPVISFWIKSDRVYSGTGSLRVYLTGYSGSTDIGNFNIRLQENGFDYLASGYSANNWVRVLIDTTDSTQVFDESADELSATTLGAFCFRFDNNQANTWDIYIDDVSVHEGLS